MLLALMLGVVEGTSATLENIVFSLSAFLVWIRVIHLLKCFSETAFLIRMATQILFKMRYLITFLVIAIIAFGYCYFFL